MRPTTRTTWLALTIATACLGCAAIRTEEARSDENLLAAAGFRIRPADTPARQAELATMPPLTMMRRTKDGNLVFTYADPYNCKCLYVGTEDDFQAWKRLSIQRQIAQENLDTSLAEENAAMSWGMWGPWWW